MQYNPHEKMISSLETMVDSIGITDCVPFSDKKIRMHILLAKIYADNNDFYKSFINDVRATNEHNNMFCNYVLDLMDYIRSPSLMKRSKMVCAKESILEYSDAIISSIMRLPDEEPYYGVKSDMCSGFELIKKNVEFRKNSFETYFMARNNLNN